MPQAIAIIPARYASQRFPGKVLADRTGKPLIQHVYERVCRADLVERVIVATDDRRVFDAVEAFGGEVMMSRGEHLNGTSRIAEVACDLDASVIVNVQADEPEIEPDLVDTAIRCLDDHPGCPVATLASPFCSDEDPADPNIVKVVVDAAGRALYFSRALIPCDRDGDAGKPALKHLGLYAYRREFLLDFARLAPTPLERIERLEQLRVLEHGHHIAVAIVTAQYHGIDTPEQYDDFVKRRLRGTVERTK